MALNKLKIKKKSLIQISLLFFGLLIIFFTYFYDRNKEPSLDQTIKKEIPKDVVEKEGFNTLLKILLTKAKTQMNNDFVLNAEYAEFATNEVEYYLYEKIVCRFFLKMELP